MNKLNFFFSLMTILFSLACTKATKNRKSEIVSIIERNMSGTVPNNSDKHFVKAIKLLQMAREREAIPELRAGLSDLKLEGKDLSGLYKLNLLKAMDQLEALAIQIENGNNLPLESIRDAIMNAEINIAHETQISQDGYVQEDSNNIIFKKAPEHFSMTLSKLRRIKNNINYEKKTEYEILLKEGEKLEQEYKLWAQNATLYIKKSNEYFKKNSHKYVYIPNPFPLPY